VNFFETQCTILLVLKSYRTIAPNHVDFSTGPNISV